MLQNIRLFRNMIGSQGNWKILQNAALAVAVILGYSQSVQAENTKKNDNVIQISCNPFASDDINTQCSSDSVSIVEIEENKIAQTRRGRRRKSKVAGYYGGFSLGVGFPSGDVELTNDVGTDFPDSEYNSGFIGSLFGGIKFTKNLSADIELLLGLGGLDTDALDDFTNDPSNNISIVGDYESEGDYSAFAFYLNPRFELPLNQNGSLSVYASPGIGISQTNVNFQADDDGIENTIDLDLSNTGFTYQVKGGASLSISDTIGIFGQLRYASLPTDEDIDNINVVSTEVGLKFNF